MAMPVTVIFDGMSSAHDLPSKLWMTLYEFTHTEECRERAMLVQSIEHQGCYHWVRSVIDGNRNAGASAAALWQAGPIRAQ
jgi:hypothetical protein